MRGFRPIIVTLILAAAAQPALRAQSSGAGTSLRLDAPAAEAGVAAQQAKTKKAAKAPDNSLKLVWKDRPSLRAGDLFRLDVRALLQADVRESEQDLSDVGGTFKIERGRAGIKGNFLKYFEYEVTRDFTNGGAWQDVYLNVRPIQAVQVQVGRFKVPFSYDRLTSPAELDFIYRSLGAVVLAPGRDLGVMLHARVFKRTLHYQVGFFRGDGENVPRIEPFYYLEPGEPPPSQKSSVAARVAVSPLRPFGVPDSWQPLEIGVAFTSSEAPEGPNNLRGESVFGYHIFPRGVYVKGPRRRLGVEATWVPGPFSAKWEYIRATDARLEQGVGNEQALDNDLPDLVARSWYLSGTWVVTGEKKDGGVVPRKPLFHGGIGAIEVGARYEVSEYGGGDLSEPASLSPRAANVAGNADRAWTIGVTWYLNRWVKVQVNGIREAIEDSTRTPVPDKPAFWSGVCRLQFAM